jgi:hypothetical protein
MEGESGKARRFEKNRNGICEIQKKKFWDCVK